MGVMELPALTIAVHYTCRMCGVEDAIVNVRARGEEQDVVNWLQETCARAIYNDHIARSPQCPATSISEVKIPIAGADKIGGVAQN